MPDRPSSRALRVEGDDARRGPVGKVPSEAPQAEQIPAPFAVLGHEILFTQGQPRCEICGEPVAPEQEDGFAMPGKTTFLVARGDDVRHEEGTLCPPCAVAVGVRALAAWEMDDEG